jgi:transmembrane sensor
MDCSKTKMTFDEIILSEEFQQYVHHPNDEINDYWDSFCKLDTNNNSEFEKALKIHQLLISNKKPKVDPILRSAQLNALLKRIEYEDFYNKFLKPPFFKKPAFRIAASVSIILSLSYLLSLVWVNLKSPLNTTAYNEIIVPAGEKSQVLLPDGSKIWLNSESKLRYPSQFIAGHRDVYLEGEAFLEVSKIKRSKFYVHTQGVNIEVLGTVFNVKSYPEDNTVETSVVEGKVMVDASSVNKNLKPVILHPVERAIFYKTESQLSYVAKEITHTRPKLEKEISPLTRISVGIVNIKNVTCWKDQYLVFDNETFEEMGIKISRWYKIQVEIKDEHLKKQRFTGKFINNETFYQVMDAIKLTTPLKYEFKDNILTVSPELETQKHKK